VSSVVALATATTTFTPGIQADAEATTVAALTGEVFEAGVFEGGVFGFTYDPSVADATATTTNIIVENTIPIPSSTGFRIVAGMEVWVDGVRVDPSNVTGPISVSRHIYSNIQSATFAVKQGALGDPFTTGGPPTCKKSIDIKGVYYINQAAYTYSLLTDGIVDTMQVAMAPDGTVVERYDVLDKGARIANELITLIIPQCSNMRRDKLVRKILGLAGETQFQLPPMNRIKKEVQYVDADPVVSAQEHLDVEGYRLFWGVGGGARVARMGFKSGVSYAPAVTINEAAIVDVPQPQVRVPADAITLITAETSGQVLEGDGNCGDKTVRLESKSEAEFAVARYGFSQNGGTGAISGSALTEEAKLQNTSLVVFEKTFRCGALVREETKTYKWYNPETTRYKYDTGTSLWKYGVLDLPRFRTSPAVDGDEPAFLYWSDEWLLVSHETVDHYWDHPGFTVTGASGFVTADDLLIAAGFSAYDLYPVTRGLEAGHGTHFLGTKRNNTIFVTEGIRDQAEKRRIFGLARGLGYKLGSRRTLRQWYNPISSLQLTSDSEPRNGQVATGDKVGRSNDSELLIPTAVEVEVIETDVDGNTRQRTNYQYGWVRRAGSTYLYHDGTTSSDLDEVFSIKSKTREKFILSSQERHTSFMVSHDQNLNLVTQETNDKEGGPDAAERLPFYDEDQLIDIDIEDVENLCRLPVAESVPLSVQVEGSATCYLDNEVKISIPYAENAEELEVIGRLLISESGAFHVTVTTPPLFYVDIGKVIRVTIRKYNVDHVARVHSIEHSWDGSMDSAILSVLDLRLL